MIARAMLLLLIAAPASAQVRFSRPFTGGYRLGYGFDNDGGRSGCTDYGCGRACYDGHTGEDFATPRGTEIRAGAAGTVESTFNGCANTGYVGNPCGGRCGNHVRIRHADGSSTVYCHMELGSIAVSTGQSVSCGRYLGRSASSGSSSGPHLHFGYRPAGASSQEVFQGSCGRSSTRWVEQRGYLEAPGVSCGECTNGATRSCGSNTGACVAGTQRCEGGTWGGCAGAVGPTSESCNARDDDCDGRSDEGLSRTCGSDVGECRTGTETCTAGMWTSCAGSIGPTPERCDALDNDCDGAADDEDVCELEELVLQSGSYDTDSDIDGDGRADACACGADLECHLASGHGFERAVPGPAVAGVGFDDPSRYSTLRMGDVDGDGLADACLRLSDGVRCWRSADGRGFDLTFDGPRLSDAEGFDHASRYTSIRLADVDGDGLADVCARWPDGLRCQRSLGNGFSDEAILLPELADDAGFTRVEHYGTLRTGDLDGDGRADVCARDASGVVCWPSTGRAFGQAIVGPSWTDAEGWSELDHWSTIRLADVDGDGRADLCARTPDGFQCHPSTRRGFGTPYIGPRLPDEEGWGDKSHYATLRMGDVDGDGDADLCGRDRDGLVCWLFDGRGFDVMIEGPALSDAAGWTEPAWFRTIRLADVNADGRADLCARDDAGLRCWRSDGIDFSIELPGPAWADGWSVPERFGTIRLGGGAAARAMGMHGDDPLDPSMAGGCSCRTVDAGGSWTWILVAWLVWRRKETT